MSKELDYLDNILNYKPLTLGTRTIIECIKEKIQHLETIDNANPSEALECLEEMWELSCDSRKPEYILYETIKQTLIKAQEQENEIAYIEKIKTMMKQKDCILRYIESEDCFAVKTILSDGWYKLTSELIENNIREEIKPLPLIEKNKQLKEENVELKKVLEILFEKNVNIGLVKVLGSVEQYNQTYIYDNMRNVKWCLTEEEFDLLKRYCYRQDNA